MEIEDRLSKRKGLLDDMEFLLKEVTYVKIHQEEFKLPRHELWVKGQEQGQVHVDG